MLYSPNSALIQTQLEFETPRRVTQHDPPRHPWSSARCRLRAALATHGRSCRGSLRLVQPRL